MLENSIVYLVIVLIIFLVCRELVCWYWKINYATKLLEQILQELRGKNPEPLKNPDPTNPIEENTFAKR